MIVVHRLGHDAEPLHMNPDLIATVEPCPDTVVTLITGAKVVVAEAPWEVTDAIRSWRAGVLARALEQGDAVSPPARAVAGVH